MDNCPHTDAGACSFCYSSLLAKVKLQSTEVSKRDSDWVLAIATALGTDSGFEVPIVPEVELFKQLFAAVSGRQND